MKFNFDDKVVLKIEGFYNGAKGVVIEYDSMEDKYTVLLANGCRKAFYGRDLRKCK